ncbi:cobamide remodeling phosphodiesterase CbiR [Desulfobacter latus]|uniref:Sugar phosphate isomerase/epimerase n=1 Tax=Desulfobacter latus TaxID=2292 RepID=A0A850T4B6_9BACT|nr:cobamide remodeling phosphodiesterase CbiR [Desulfobacter latus]NWH03675.1 sugar phosphate isomerase/epimerase [Desulfobacter latus]
MMQRPFRLGTTSFIYPDHIIPNVQKIGAFFDEIELLVFESKPEAVIPSRNNVKELAELSRDLDLTYNVHLPTDINLSAPELRLRRDAADTLKRVIERFSIAPVTRFTLHLEMDKPMPSQAGIEAWQNNTRQGLELLLPALEDPAMVGVETLWYPPYLFKDLVNEFGLSVCADLGHHIKYGYDIHRTFELFGPKINLIHLHGVDTRLKPPKDHIGLDKTAPGEFRKIMDPLKHYTGTVCLEVFNLADLQASLAALAQTFKNIVIGVEKPAQRH